VEGQSRASHKGGLMKNLSFVSWDLTAHHKLPVKDFYHQHTWTITIYWKSYPWKDARVFQDQLKGIVEPLQGKYISDLSQERLAKMFLCIKGVKKVMVWREQEKIGCEVTKWI
jgi:hypothetical protein